MKVVFVSNFFNHHQEPFSIAMKKHECVEYSFIATEEVPEERKKLGYSSAVPEYVYLSFSDDRHRVKKLLDEADVIITGSAPESMIRSSISNGKLVFRYSERPLKNGLELIKYPIRFLKWHQKNPFWRPIYLLCASAYTVGDYARFGLFKKKSYKWGYFPETKQYDIDALMRKKSATTILWCGRFLPLKHPDDVIAAATRLKNDGYDFDLRFIGMGEMDEKLKEMVCKNGLQDYVHFLGSMDSKRVREYMETAGIYLFTSDRNEGWGAVLNESMNSGCAVIASHAIGAVPFMVKDNENGLIYESENIEMLYEKIRYLLDNPEEQRRLGQNAYQTIIGEWNAEEVANRFVNLAERILAGEKNPDFYESGPCSKATVLKDKWKK